MGAKNDPQSGRLRPRRGLLSNPGFLLLLAVLSWNRTKPKSLRMHAEEKPQLQDCIWARAEQPRTASVRTYVQPCTFFGTHTPSDTFGQHLVPWLVWAAPPVRLFAARNHRCGSSVCRTLAPVSDSPEQCWLLRKASEPRTQGAPQRQPRARSHSVTSSPASADAPNSVVLPFSTHRWTHAPPSMMLNLSAARTNQPTSLGTNRLGPGSFVVFFVVGQRPCRVVALPQNGLQVHQVRCFIFFRLSCVCTILECHA